jgi:poly-gamma-glutamate synthesis protein (capsule biosynthesis protein)
MISKLNATGGRGQYFAARIGELLSSADLTHTSNEVSFANNCQNDGSMRFCAPWAMLETLEASGIDIVELTGNHNNDYGTNNNQTTINKYHELGMGTFGGGLNLQAAAQPYEIDQDGARIALLGYNRYDAPGTAPIAGSNRPGANPWNKSQMISDIQAAKQKGQFVIVDFQYQECYSYPPYGQEMPACDAPIAGQRQFFRDAIDAGADMVVGTQAHQPQTYELYHGKPIYYGLGNLYFDQYSWPGNSRGLVLTHYFVQGRYVQTKITTTVYDKNMQTRVMNEENSRWFLKRLAAAR